MSPITPLKGSLYVPIAPLKNLGPVLSPSSRQVALPALGSRCGSSGLGKPKLFHRLGRLSRVYWLAAGMEGRKELEKDNGIYHNNGVI